MIPLETARAKVIEIVTARKRAPEATDANSAVETPATETIDLARDPSRALRRILAEKIIADRDYPPFDRSIRDGFALRSADASAPGARLECVGELRAGGSFNGVVEPGECVEIMTGAGVPKETDAVVMIEHIKRDGRTIT